MVLKSDLEYENFKTKYLNQYFESLNISSIEPDWNILILQASLKNFQDCKALLDMLDDESYVENYKFYIEKKFEEMVDWFLKEKLEINTRPLPAFAENNRKVCLLDLYMAVKREGGHRRMTDNNMWAVNSRDKGFDYKEGDFMRLMYAMYLDILSKSLDDGEGSSRRPSADQEGVAEEHYVFFASNDWYGLKKLQRRKRFDFKRAEKAVNEANDTVILHSRKKQ
ncbi:putative transcription factor & chromatin remodeling ARID family [Helianthus anomalus]